MQKLTPHQEKMILYGELAFISLHDIYGSLDAAQISINDNDSKSAIQSLDRVRRSLRNVYDISRFDGESKSKTSALKVCEFTNRYFKKVSLNCKTDFNIRLDIGLLAQILSNLVINAYKHNKGEIEVLLSIDSPYITVSDDGQGIDESIRDKIFDAGFTTSSKKHEMAGCGLFAVKQLCERFNIPIQFKNKTILKGANFSLDFSNVIEN